MNKNNLPENLLNIFNLYEFDENSIVRNLRTVQNKLHWAITGKTAAEIIYDSADATKIHMRLTNWKQVPNGKIIIEVLYANENN